MTALVFEEAVDEAQPEAAAREAPAVHNVEDDGQDWCAWWAAYSEMME